MHVKSLIEKPDSLIRKQDIFFALGHLNNGGVLIKCPKTDNLMQLEKGEYEEHDFRSSGHLQPL